jgi:hypothetical protein
VAQLQDIWNKFNPRERLIAIGSAVVVLAWLVSLFTYFGGGLTVLALLAAIASLVIVYLKYAPNTNITWPAPVSLMLIVLGAIAAIAVVIDFLRELSFLTGGEAITGIALLVGAGLMVWGAWQEYQIEKPAMPNFGSTTTPPAPPASTAPPPAAPVPPSAAVPPPPPVTLPADETDEAPPA